MEKVIINSYEEFEKLVGQQIGVSEWLEIQPQIHRVRVESRIHTNRRQTTEKRTRIIHLTSITV